MGVFDRKVDCGGTGALREGMKVDGFDASVFRRSSEYSRIDSLVGR